MVHQDADQERRELLRTKMQSLMALVDELPDQAVRELLPKQEQQQQQQQQQQQVEQIELEKSVQRDREKSLQAEKELAKVDKEKFSRAKNLAIDIGILAVQIRDRDASLTFWKAIVERKWPGSRWP
jgi:hypothetical protein